MYNAIILLLVALAALLLFTGIARKRKSLIGGGIGIGVLTILFFSFLGFWGDYLWFANLGFSNRFWTILLSQIGFGLIGLVFGAAIILLLTLPLPGKLKIPRIFPVLFGGLIGTLWGVSNWEKLLKFFNAVSAGIKDPILGKDAGFYMFSLPLLNELYYLFFMLLIVGLIIAFAALFIKFTNAQNVEVQLPITDRKTKNKLYNSFYLVLGLFLLLLAFGKLLNRYNLLFTERGVVTGPAWTDVNILLPAYSIVIVLTALVGVAFIIPGIRKKVQGLLAKKAQEPEIYILQPIGIGLAVLWLLALTLIPSLFQWTRVEPNEITFEEPYIENNIKLTRYGYDLQDMEEKQFPIRDSFSSDIVADNKNIFDNVRLWDWRALNDVYDQFQEIRLYYEFNDIDIDRYQIDGEMRQVMVSAREMDTKNLPEKSQTFINKRFKYTHGYGITMTDVSKFTEESLPNMLIKDIPPVSKYPGLSVDRPEIYYGESYEQHVIVNSKEREFDYPKGEENAYTDYKGSGGVPLHNFWRRFLYGWQYDGTRLLLSGYPTNESRIMFHRRIQERVDKIAPFITWDEDPYVVLANGELYWILDGYTTSKRMPYSKTFTSRESIEYQDGNQQRSLNNTIAPQFRGSNYIRNSVKAVVNAYNGNVDFYQFDKEDPVINVYKNIFPDLIQEKSEMPESLRDNVRYPVDYLLAQGHIYAKYHMTNPDVFYNQEDLWTRATEKYYGQLKPVDPYYVMWEIPGTDKPQFTLMMPYTPKNRQVAIGWIAGLSDGERYGDFMAYQFPKDKRILGPQQVESKIDQDAYLSQKLSLWDQRGSRVIRGNVLAIPVENNLFYVEPIYLQSETAAYPELRIVVIMHNDQISYAPTFDEALKKMMKNKGTATLAPTDTMGQAIMDKTRDESNQELIQKARDAFNNYLESTGEKDYEEASKALDELEKTLDRLSQDEVDTINQQSDQLNMN